MSLPRITPAPLVVVREPFDHPEWVFELKYDGFRALAYIEAGEARLVSRKNHTYKAFGPLCAALGLIRHDAVLDGEIVCLGNDGRPQFYELLYRRGVPRFCAFDLLWLEGRDLRGQPLLERKRRLRALIPPHPCLPYVDHVQGAGRDLVRVVCERDLEGIVAKHQGAPYGLEGSWLKIRNPCYTQAAGRHELFQQRRSLARG